MVNQHTKRLLDAVVVAQMYRSGVSVLAIAQRLGVDRRRLRSALREQGVPVRSASESLRWNAHNRKLSLDRAAMHRLYVEEKRSIRTIEALTGAKNIRYHLVRYDIPLRGYSDTRRGAGDALTPEARARATASVRGPNHGGWKGGRRNENDAFYYSAGWRALSIACKRRDHFTCQTCARTLRPHRLRAHHVVPRINGGPDHLSNLTTLCNPCHRRCHVESENIRALGRARVMVPHVSLQGPTGVGVDTSSVL